MAIFLHNALLVDLDPLRAEYAALRIERGRIAARGPKVTRQPGDEIVDCGGAVVLPGLVNGHMHLYSALAAGMPAPPRCPTNFAEVLELVWWRLDRALDSESVEMSARIGALDAVRCGTTTLIDHHAAPSCIPGTLDDVERGMTAVGLRGVLCYETTDRNGPAGRDAGVAENARYLEKCQHREDHRFGGLVGAHASFTVGEDTLTQLAEVARKYKTGLHIHVAEDPCDEQHCRREYKVGLIERFARRGTLEPEAVFGHGTHLDADSIARLGAAGALIAHCPRSNMNNAVGYAPVAKIRQAVMLGTDGIGSDMFAEARAAWWISQHQHAGLSPQDILGMLSRAARRASATLGITLGRLEVDAAADIVLTDYYPATPLTTENLAGHFLFGMAARHVASVLIDGRWIVRNRVVQTCDEVATRHAALPVTAAMWDRMSQIV